MPKGAPGQHRRPKKRFTKRATGYLDEQSFELVLKAAETLDENISEFVAKAVQARAEAVLKNKHK